ncbi:hypothetical protein CRUP_023087 [Coryphaenoides rupestris]|nr:hypothetical protein CRUP_023087 [Coryphaenoides rupestris]
MDKKGLEKRGTALLLEHLAGSLASAISVSTHLDIAPQHHLFMMGRNGSNIKHIIQRTGAQIHFPDPNSPQKKSTVYIQGTIESVCLARQYLMRCVKKKKDGDRLIVAGLGFLLSRRFASAAVNTTGPALRPLVMAG